ncbi:MAG TPA: HlyD family secretion protein [Caulobacteraceae bacterium]|nr:HlyD family secretion protein [Caulobacteraceae bacterium]
MSGSTPTRRPVWAGGALVGALAIAAAIGGWIWIHGQRDKVSTDDAYVQADRSIVSPKVRGAIAEVLVADDQPVKAGAALVRLDPAEYDLKVRAAQGDLMAAEAAAKAARAGLARLDAEEKLAKGQLDQAKALAGGDAAAQATLRQAFETARGQALVAARSRGEIQAALAQADAQAFRARTELDAARQERAATTVTSPVDGVVASVQAAPGQLVQPGVRLMTVVRPSTLYVLANFKETQTGRMVPGQRAEIRVDALPGVRLTGRVASLAPGTGSQFALLPFEPGAGNFTKIVQRVPVHIALDPGQPDVARLRSGLSVVVTVRLK